MLQAWCELFLQTNNATSRIAEAECQMIVDHTGRLQVGVKDCCSQKFEAKPFEFPGYGIGNRNRAPKNWPIVKVNRPYKWPHPIISTILNVSLRPCFLT